MKNLNIFSLITEYDNAKSGGVLNVPNVSFVDEDSSARYLLKFDFTHNGYEYVDLGLPSGLKWATCNVGASSPEQAGRYFAWGETKGYTGEQVNYGRRYFDSESYKAASISADLTLKQDAAHVNLGGNWRMPTKAEYQELIDNCTSTWTTNYNGTGVKGRIFTSKTNGNSVFFPASSYCYLSVVDEGSGGEYWAASWVPSNEATNCAWYFNFDSGSTVELVYNDRYYGRSVRGVFK